MLRKNGLRLDRPEPKRGKLTRLRPFAVEELERFFTQRPADLTCLYPMMYATGARLTELMPSDRTDRKGLLESEVDLDKRVVVIRTAKARVPSRPTSGAGPMFLRTRRPWGMPGLRPPRRRSAQDPPAERAADPRH